MKKRLPCLAFAFLALVLCPERAQAWLEFRVSVKLFLNEQGLPPIPAGQTNYDTFQAVRDAFVLFNQRFDLLGHGIHVQLTDVTGISWQDGGSTFFSLPARNSDNRNQLELAAKTPGSTLQYRPDAINVYINSTSSGIQSGPEVPLLGDVVFVGGGVSTIPTPAVENLAWVKTMLHESFHALGVVHTQGAGCNGCPPDPIGGNCPGPGDDSCDDTIPDYACWNRDQLAAANFSGLVYTNLNSAQAQLVDRVYTNLMSYHAQSFRGITHDQMERVIDTLNTYRFNIATGFTVFVDPANSCNRPEDLDEPFKTVAEYTAGWASGTLRHGVDFTLDANNPPSGAPKPPCAPDPLGLGLPCYPPPLSVCLGGPWKNLPDALTHANPGDRLEISAGNYGGARTIKTRLTLAVYRGSAFLGKN